MSNRITNVALLVSTLGLATCIGACASSGGTASQGGSGGESAGGEGGSTNAGGAGGENKGGTGGKATGGTGGGGGNAAGAGGGGGQGTAGQGGQGTAGQGGDGGTAAGGQGGFGIGGPSRCANAQVALCEDFENGIDATRLVTTNSGDATATVDELHAARGKKALHVHTDAGKGRAFIRHSKSFPIMNNMVYGRMFVWLEDPLTTDGHFTLAEGVGTGTPAMIRFGGQDKKFGVGTDGGSSGDWTDKDTLVANKKWLCTEFQFKSDTNEFRVWLDDKEITGLRSGPAKHPSFTMPQFASMWFGWWMYNMQEPQDVWIDEIAIHSAPIGCAK